MAQYTPVLTATVSLVHSYRTILHGVRVRLCRGEVTAVLGTSGSGKSMLLQLLADRLDLDSFGFKGSVATATASYTDAESTQCAAATLAAFKPRVSYVPPDDVVFRFDTPREAIIFRHQLAFGSSHDEAAAVAAALLDDLGLSQCADNLIAPGLGLRGISGGQRRRTCIAMALATRPEVLLLDEPTTGLDSTTAKQVMATVHRIARQYNCAVLQALQQPGADLFPHFDALIMLDAAGAMAYTGPVCDAPPSVPKNGLMSRREEADDEEGKDDNDAACGTTEQGTSDATDEHELPTTRSHISVLGLLLRRHFRALVRDPLALLMRVVQTFVIAIFFGIAFLDTAYTVDNFKQVFGLLMAIVMASFVPVQTGAAVFPMEKPVFLEEQKLPFRYPAALYAVSKTVVESACAWPLAVIFAAVFGPLVGLPGAAVAHLLLTSVLLGSAAEGFGFFVSTMARPALAVGVITPITGMVMMVVGTSLANGEGATKDFFDVLKHFAFLRNGFGATGVDIIPRVAGPCSQPGRCYFNTAQEALAYYDLADTTLGQEWGLLAAWAAVFRIGAAIALTAVGWNQRVRFDAGRHTPESTAAPTERPASTFDGSVSVVVASAEVDPMVAYDPTPCPAGLAWDVEFSVRRRFGEGSQEWRKILSRMRGEALPGRCLAIMGGSGAGKSTLVEALSIRLSATSLFTVTERKCDVSTLPRGGGRLTLGAETRALVAFVHQEPEFIEGLTAAEVVRCAVDLAAPDVATDTNAITNAILGQVGLIDVAAVEAVTLSGSQRKRLAVAAALAQRRPIVMLDEPTSGLDPESALHLLQLFQNLAQTRGLTVLYTLHQPGDELLPHIDDLLLLSAGRVVYHGPLAAASDSVFASHPCPPGSNATDHYLALSQDADIAAELIAAWDKTCPYRRDSAALDEHEQPCAEPEVTAGALVSAHSGMRCGPLGFAALTRRAFVATVTRVPLYSLVLRFVALYMLVPLVVGIAMFDQAGNVVTTQNACFVAVLTTGFASTLVPIMDLHVERLAFLREQEADQYSPVAYYAARSLAALPLELLGVVSGTLIVYFMVGFHADAESFFTFLVVSALLQQASIGMGYTVGVLVHSLAVSAALSTLWQVINATGCGVILSPGAIDSSRWLHVVEFVSPPRQAMLLVLRNEMRHHPHGVETVRAVLGFDRSFDEPPVLWAMLVLLSVGLRLLAACCFKLATRPQPY